MERHKATHLYDGRACPRDTRGEWNVLFRCFFFVRVMSFVPGAVFRNVVVVVRLVFVVVRQSMMFHAEARGEGPSVTQASSSWR